jgi:anti-sigma factor RsiW
MNELDERLLSALIDGEADEGELRGLLGPVNVDSPPSGSLLRRAAILRALRDSVRRSAAQYQAPAGLRATVERIVREQGRAPGGAGSARSWLRPWPLRFALPALCAAVVLSSAVTLLALRPAADDVLEGELVSAHLRTLMSPSPVQVASSDQHTVKPWFGGRLNYTLPVADLKDQGFALVGGSIEVFGGKPVGALLFQHRKHLIDVYVMPSDQYVRFAPLAGAQRNGFNIVTHAEGGFGYVAVSDLNAADLGKLPGLLAKAAQ